jgi:hypothetical protein
MGDPVTATIVVGTTAQVYGAYSGGQAAKKEAKYNKKIAAQNQKIAKEQAKDIVTRGAEAEIELATDAIRLADNQLLAFAGSGIDVSSGVAQATIEDTARITAADIIRLKHNVKKDKWATEVGAVSSAAQSQLDDIRARSAQRAANLQIISAITGGVESFYTR